MAIPNVKLVQNNNSASADILGKSNSFLDSYIYSRNSRYNALYEKNKDILQMENYAINKQDAGYLYETFMEHVGVLETVINKMRNFAIRTKADVISNLQSILPTDYTINKFEDAINRTIDFPDMQYVHYDVKPIEYANFNQFAALFNNEAKNLIFSRSSTGMNAMMISKCSKFIKSVTDNYRTSYEGLLEMEKINIMTPSNRRHIRDYFNHGGKIITAVNKDFRTYHIFLKQFKSVIEVCSNLEPFAIIDEHITLRGYRGCRLTFADYVTLYKHFSTMMKDLLDLVTLYDNLFYNKLYAIQSNIEVYNSIMNYSIKFAEARKNSDIFEESAILLEAYWDGYINSNEIDAHNLINGNYAAQELLWDSADEDGDELFDEIDDTEVIEEAPVGEKITSEVKGKYLVVLSYIKDIYRKWQGIEAIEVSEKEYNCYVKMKKLSKDVCDSLLEIMIDKKESISYESKYEEFLDTVKEYKKVHKAKDEKTATIKISDMHELTKYYENIYHKSIKTDVEYKTKYKTALWVTVTRSLYMINSLLYGVSGKGQGNTNMLKKGIQSKRFGSKSMTGFNIKKLGNNEIYDILKKLREASSYSSYKNLFDEICKIYGKEDVSVFKLLDLEKYNKLVFISYSKLKPMTIKAGTKLYHISPSSTISELEPKFKSKDNITFYAKPRIYVTDKICNPKKILPNVKDPKIYELTISKDIEAYRDSEYGAWYHNCIYIESESPIKVKDITNEAFPKDSKAAYINNNNKSRAGYIDNSKLNECVNINNLLGWSLLNESADDDFDNITVDDRTIEVSDKDVKKICDKYVKLKPEDKITKTPAMLRILKKIMGVLSHTVGIGFILDGKNSYKDNKEFMRDLKREMLMNHETYNKVYNSLMVKSILQIVLGVLLNILSITAVVYTLSNTSIGDLKRISDCAKNIGSKVPGCSKLCDRISKVSSNIVGKTFTECCDYVDIVDNNNSKFENNIETDRISNMEISQEEFENAESDIDKMNEDTSWTQDTGEEAGNLCTIRSSIVI